jgi:hypothetical protein
MKIHSLLLAAIFTAATASHARACAACYGDTTGSKMGNAADIGIIAMVIIMLFMLAAVGGFMWHLAYRARHPLPDYSELLSEENGEDLPPHAQPEAL